MVQLSRMTEQSDRRHANARRNVVKVREALARAFGETFGQAELAAAAGLKVDTLRALERGRRRPSLDMLAAIGEAVGIGVDALLGDEVPTLPPLRWIVAMQAFGDVPPGLLTEIRATIARHRAQPAPKAGAHHVDPHVQAEIDAALRPAVVSSGARAREAAAPPPPKRPAPRNAPARR